MGLREDNLQLRRLARAVMQGEMRREDYYRRRRRMIDGYAGDPVDPEDETPTLGMSAVDTTHPDLPPVSDPTNPGSVVAPLVDGLDDRLPVADEKADLWIGLVAVMVVFVVVWGLVALFM